MGNNSSMALLYWLSYLSSDNQDHLEDLYWYSWPDYEHLTGINIQGAPKLDWQIILHIESIIKNEVQTHMS